jgi:Protein of unknown function (DUF1688)
VLQRLGAALLEHPEYFERNGISRPGNLVDYLLSQVQLQQQLNSVYNVALMAPARSSTHCLVPQLSEHGTGRPSSNANCAVVYICKRRLIAAAVKHAELPLLLAVFTWYY